LSPLGDVRVPCELCVKYFLQKRLPLLCGNKTHANSVIFQQVPVSVLVDAAPIHLQRGACHAAAKASRRIRRASQCHRLAAWVLLRF